MIFILAAWLLVLLTFAIWLRALHSIQIYAHTPLQMQEQTWQVENVASITQMLLALAVACTGLHFMLANDVVHASAMARAHNFTF
jgi:hypothetical protein